MSEMPIEERQLRADAERNRRRLLEAAQALFRERGLDVSVAEIAQAADMGRGTLFRNFASKEDLIAAIVAERMHEAAARGRELLAASEQPDEALFEFVGELVGRQQLDRALFEALAETWLAREEIRKANDEILEVLGGLVERAQACGAVRADVGAIDVLMLFKGACVAATSFGHGDPAIIDRHLDLIRASLAMSSETVPLRGRTPTLEEISGAERA
jgi:AcrR family transcriptional regulator